MAKASDLLQRYGASSFKDLSNRVFKEADQALMAFGLWDYEENLTCGSWLTNKIYRGVLLLDVRDLSGEDVEWCKELVWLWNHHAISCAIWRYRDLDAARRFAAIALSYQTPGHPNKITQLFALLLDDKLEEAKQLASTVCEAEEDAAKFLIRSYLAGWYEQAPAT